MRLQLYEMAHSPFCIPVAQILERLGLAFERIEVPNWDRGEIMRLTKGQYYQVPVLVHGDQIIWESSATSQDIARHIDAEWADSDTAATTNSPPHRRAWPRGVNAWRRFGIEPVG